MLSEMATRAKKTKSDIIYSAMRRTWHGNLLKFPSLRDIEQILSSWRNEEKEKQTTIESFSEEHSYHMERLTEDISGFENTIEYNVWPNVWNTDDYLLTEAHRESIVRIGNSEKGASIITEHNKNDKQQHNRIQELKSDKSLTLKKLKAICAAENVTCDGKQSRIGLIRALSAKEFCVPKRASASALTGINPHLPHATCRLKLLLLCTPIMY
jgi:DNA-binding transcriptional MerR regulator